MPVRSLITDGGPWWKENVGSSLQASILVVLTLKIVLFAQNTSKWCLNVAAGCNVSIVYFHASSRHSRMKFPRLFRKSHCNATSKLNIPTSQAPLTSKYVQTRGNDLYVQWLSERSSALGHGFHEQWRVECKWLRR